MEMQFDAFSYPALDQVRSRTWRSTGTGPGATHRSPWSSGSFAGGIGAAEHHSESPETYYVHTAGLKVVVPSTPLDAYSLLRQSIADPDPVVFLEPKSRYWSKETGDLQANACPSAAPAWCAGGTPR